MDMPSSKNNQNQTKYANSNLNGVFAKSSSTGQVSSSNPSRFSGGMLVLSKRSRATAGSKVVVPKPVNLPSLRKEHSGNDPTTQLVPSSSASGGWTKAEEAPPAPVLETKPSALTSGSTWALDSKGTSGAWIPPPVPSALAKAPVSLASDRHLNPEEYPSLAVTGKAAPPTKPNKTLLEAQQDLRHWAEDERAFSSRQPEWSSDISSKVEESRLTESQPSDYIGRGRWDTYPEKAFNFSSTKAEFDDDFDIPRKGRGAPSRPSFDIDDHALFPPPPPPRPAQTLLCTKADTDESEEDHDPEREAFEAELARVAADLEKGKKDERNLSAEKASRATPDVEGIDASSDVSSQTAELSWERDESLAPLPQLVIEPANTQVEAVVSTAPESTKPAAKELNEEEEENKRKQAIAERQKRIEERRNNLLMLDEEEKRRKAAAAAKLRQLEEQIAARRAQQETEEKAALEQATREEDAIGDMASVEMTSIASAVQAKTDQKDANSDGTMSASTGLEQSPSESHTQQQQQQQQLPIASTRPEPSAEPSVSYKAAVEASPDLTPQAASISTADEPERPDRTQTPPPKQTPQHGNEGQVQQPQPQLPPQQSQIVTNQLPLPPAPVVRSYGPYGHPAGPPVVACFGTFDDALLEELTSQKLAEEIKPEPLLAPMMTQSPPDISAGTGRERQEQRQALPPSLGVAQAGKVEQAVSAGPVNANRQLTPAAATAEQAGAPIRGGSMLEAVKPTETAGKVGDQATSAAQLASVTKNGEVASSAVAVTGVPPVALDVTHDEVVMPPVNKVPAGQTGPRDSTYGKRTTPSAGPPSTDPTVRGRGRGRGHAAPPPTTSRPSGDPSVSVTRNADPSLGLGQEVVGWGGKRQGGQGWGANRESIRAPDNKGPSPSSVQQDRATQSSAGVIPTAAATPVAPSLSVLSQPALGARNSLQVDVRSQPQMVPMSAEPSGIAQIMMSPGGTELSRSWSISVDVLPPLLSPRSAPQAIPGACSVEDSSSNWTLPIAKDVAESTLGDALTSGVHLPASLDPTPPKPSSLLSDSFDSQLGLRHLNGVVGASPSTVASDMLGSDGVGSLSTLPDDLTGRVISASPKVSASSLAYTQDVRARGSGLGYSQQPGVAGNAAALVWNQAASGVHLGHAGDPMLQQQPGARVSSPGQSFYSAVPPIFSTTMPAVASSAPSSLLPGISPPLVSFATPFPSAHPYMHLGSGSYGPLCSPPSGQQPFMPTNKQPDWSTGAIGVGVTPGALTSPLNRVDLGASARSSIGSGTSEMGPGTAPTFVGHMGAATMSGNLELQGHAPGTPPKSGLSPMLSAPAASTSTFMPTFAGAVVRDNKQPAPHRANLPDELFAPEVLPMRGQRHGSQGHPLPPPPPPPVSSLPQNAAAAAPVRAPMPQAPPPPPREPVTGGNPRYPSTHNRGGRGGRGGRNEEAARGNGVALGGRGRVPAGGPGPVTPASYHASVTGKGIVPTTAVALANVSNSTAGSVSTADARVQSNAQDRVQATVPVSTPSTHLQPTGPQGAQGPLTGAIQGPQVHPSGSSPPGANHGIPYPPHQRGKGAPGPQVPSKTDTPMGAVGRGGPAGGQGGGRTGYYRGAGVGMGAGRQQWKRKESGAPTGAVPGATAASK